MSIKNFNKIFFNTKHKTYLCKKIKFFVLLLSIFLSTNITTSYAAEETETKGPIVNDKTDTISENKEATTVTNNSNLTISNTGGIKADNSLTNNGTLVNNGNLSSTITNNNPAGKFTNNSVLETGDLTNSGTFTNSNGNIASTGSLTNSNQFTITGGSANFTGSITNDKTINISGGSLNGSSLTNSENGTVSVSGTGAANISGKTDNKGTISISGGNFTTSTTENTGTITISSGKYTNNSQFTNNSNVNVEGGTLTSGSFENKGSLTIGSSSGGKVGNVTINGNFNNTGTFTNNANGNLSISGNLNNTGTSFTNNGTITMTGNNSTISGWGNTQNSGITGTLNIEGTTNITGTSNDFYIGESGKVNVSGTLNTGNLVNSGTLSTNKNGNLNISGNLTNKAGKAEEGKGIINIGGSSTVNIKKACETPGENDAKDENGCKCEADPNSGKDGAPKTCKLGSDGKPIIYYKADTGNLDNSGTINVSGGNLNVSEGNITNNKDATLNVTGGTVTTIDLKNTGNLSIGGGKIDITNSLTNNDGGKIDMTGGNVNIKKDFTNSGSANINGGTVIVSGKLTNNKEFNIGTGGTVNVTGEITNDSSGKFTISGNLTGTSFNNKNGTLTVSGGTVNLDSLINGDGSSSSSLVIDKSGSITIKTDFTNNTGATTTITSGKITIQEGNFINKGTTTIDKEGILSINGGNLDNTSGTLTNAGTIEMIGGTEEGAPTKIINWGTDNNKVSGNLNLNGGYIQVDNAFHIDTTGVLGINSASLTIKGDSSNAGTINLNSGILKVEGNITNSGTLNLTEGSLTNLTGGLVNNADSTINITQSGIEISKGLDNSGKINLSAGAITAKEDSSIKAGGSLTLDTSFAIFEKGLTNTASTIDLSNKSGLQVGTDLTNSGKGSITLNTGSLAEIKGSLNNTDGTIKLDGESQMTVGNSTTASTASNLTNGAGASISVNNSTLFVYGSTTNSGNISLSNGKFQVEKDFTNQASSELNLAGSSIGFIKGNLTNQSNISIEKDSILSLYGNLNNDAGTIKNVGTINMFGGTNFAGATTISGYGTTDKPITGTLNIVQDFVKVDSDFTIGEGSLNVGYCEMVNGQYTCAEKPADFTISGNLNIDDKGSSTIHTNGSVHIIGSINGGDKLTNKGYLQITSSEKTPSTPSTIHGIFSTDKTANLGTVEIGGASKDSSQIPEGFIAKTDSDIYNGDGTLNNSILKAFDQSLKPNQKADSKYQAVLLNTFLNQVYTKSETSNKYEFDKMKNQTFIIGYNSELQMSEGKTFYNNGVLKFDGKNNTNDSNLNIVNNGLTAFHYTDDTDEAYFNKIFINIVKNTSMFGTYSTVMFENEYFPDLTKAAGDTSVINVFDLNKSEEDLTATLNGNLIFTRGSFNLQNKKVDSIKPGTIVADSNIMIGEAAMLFFDNINFIGGENKVLYNKGHLVFSKTAGAQNTVKEVDMSNPNFNFVNDGDITVDARLNWVQDMMTIGSSTFTGKPNKDIIDDWTCEGDFETCKEKAKKELGIELTPENSVTVSSVGETNGTRTYTKLTSEMHLKDGSQIAFVGSAKGLGRDGSVLNNGILRLDTGSRIGFSEAGAGIHNYGRVDIGEINKGTDSDPLGDEFTNTKIYNFNQINIGNIYCTTEDVNQPCNIDKKGQPVAIELHKGIVNMPLYDNAIMTIKSGITVKDPSDPTDAKDILVKNVVNNSSINSNPLSLNQFGENRTILEIEKDAQFVTKYDIVSNVLQNLIGGSSVSSYTPMQNAIGNGIIWNKKEGTLTLDGTLVREDGKTKGIYIYGLAAQKEYSNEGKVEVSGVVHLSPVREGYRYTEGFSQDLWNQGEIKIASGGELHIYGNIYNRFGTGEDGSQIVEGTIDNTGSKLVLHGKQEQENAIIVSGLADKAANSNKGHLVIEDGWVKTENGNLFWNDASGIIEIGENGILQIDGIETGSQNGQLINNGTLAVVGKDKFANATNINWANSTADANTGRLTIYQDIKTPTQNSIAIISKEKGNEFVNGKSDNNIRAELGTMANTILINERDKITNYGKINVTANSLFISKGKIENKEGTNKQSNGTTDKTNGKLVVNNDLTVDSSLKGMGAEELYNKYKDKYGTYISEIDNTNGHIVLNEEGILDIINVKGIFESQDKANKGKFEIANNIVKTEGNFYNNGELILNMDSQLQVGGGTFQQGQGTNSKITISFTGMKSDDSALIIANKATVDLNTKLNISTNKLTYFFGNKDGYKIIDSNNLTGTINANNILINELPSWIDFTTEVINNDLIIKFKLNDQATQFALGKNRNQKEVGAFLFKSLQEGWVKNINNEENVLVDFVEVLLLNKAGESELVNVLDQLTLRTAEASVSMAKKASDAFNATVIKNIAKSSSGFNVQNSLGFMKANDLDYTPMTAEAQLGYMINQSAVISKNENDNEAIARKIKRVRKKAQKSKAKRNKSIKDNDIDAKQIEEEQEYALKFREPAKAYNNVWVDLISTTVNKDATVSFDKFSVNTNGFVAGIERKHETKLKNLEIAKYSYGAAFSTSQSLTENKVNSVEASYYDINATNVQMALYGTFEWGKSIVTGILSYGSTSFDQERNIIVDTNGAQSKETATANYKSTFMSIYGEYKNRVFNDIYMKGFGEFASTTQDAFEEKSAEIPGLGVTQTSYIDLRVGYGIEYIEPFITPNEKYLIMPSFGLSYIHNFFAGPVEFDTYFTSIGKDKLFTQVSENRDANIISLEAGISVGRIVGKPIVGKFNYTYDIMDHGTAHTISLKFLKTF